MYWTPWGPMRINSASGRSTIDTLRKVEMATATTAADGKALAVSLDVTNVFNSLP